MGGGKKWNNSSFGMKDRIGNNGRYEEKKWKK